MTRKMTIAILVLALCALLLPSTLIAKDKVERPWKVKGHTTARVNLSTGDWVSEDWGQATHIGRYTNEASGETVDGVPSGSGIVTAANGDQLFFNVGPPGTVTFTGGTGRFEGATGGFIFVSDPPEITYEPEDGIPTTMIIKYSYTATGTLTY